MQHEGLGGTLVPDDLRVVLLPATQRIARALDRNAAVGGNIRYYAAFVTLLDIGARGADRLAVVQLL